VAAATEVFPTPLFPAKNIILILILLIRINWDVDAEVLNFRLLKFY